MEKYVIIAIFEGVKFVDQVSVLTEIGFKNQLRDSQNKLRSEGLLMGPKNWRGIQMPQN